MIIGEAAFIGVGRIIGSGRHVYKCCGGNATIMHCMDDLGGMVRRTLLDSPASMTLRAPCVGLWALIS